MFPWLPDGVFTCLCIVVRMRQVRTHAKISLEYYRHFPNSRLSKRVVTRIWTRYKDLDLLYVIFETVGATDDLLLLILNIVFRTKGWIEVGLGGTTEADYPPTLSVKCKKCDKHSLSCCSPTNTTCFNSESLASCGFRWTNQNRHRVHVIPRPLTEHR